MGLFDFIGPASGLLFTLENIIWINLGVFIGCVFAAIPGLSDRQEKDDAEDNT